MKKLCKNYYMFSDGSMVFGSQLFVKVKYFNKDLKLFQKHLKNKKLNVLTESDNVTDYRNKLFK